MACETQQIQTLHVGRLMSEPGGADIDRGARISIDGDRIAKIETGVAGGDSGGGLIALPALCDMHDHGRGLPRRRSQQTRQSRSLIYLPRLIGNKTALTCPHA